MLQSTGGFRDCAIPSQSASAAPPGWTTPAPQAANWPVEYQGFRRIHLGRMLVTFGLMVAFFAASFFLLPLIQSWILPKAPGGISGPWIVRPIIASHFCACAIITAVSAAVVLRPIARRWRAADAERGIQFDPFNGRPAAKIALYTKGILLLMIYGFSLVAYLLSWTAVGPEGIEEHLPWGTRKYSYHRIVALQSIPRGFRSDAPVKNGPWNCVKFDDGREVTLSHDNEGLTPAELDSIAAFIADRAGHHWDVREDARQRE